MDREDKSDACAWPNRAGARSNAKGPESITGVLLSQVFDLADRCGAKTIFVSGEALGSTEMPEALRSSRHKVIYVIGGEGDAAHDEPEAEGVLRIPDVPLTRMSQVKVAAVLALGRGLIGSREIVLFLTGQAGSGVLDTLLAMDVERESELFRFVTDAARIPKGVRPEVVARVIDLATELGAEGREGRPVGALFVIGDTDRVTALSRQLVLNPFHGYKPESRNILDSHMEETVKEFSALDGAFLVRGDGVMETCGVFLNTTSNADLPHGLGARHHVGAGITSVTDSLAVAVSQSTGTVTLFRDGHILTEILRSHRLARRVPDRSADGP